MARKGLENPLWLLNLPTFKMRMMDTKTFIISPTMTAVDVKYWLSEGIERV